MTPRFVSRLHRLRLRVRRETGLLLSGPRRSGYLRKWIVLGAIIGVVAGLGAVVFYAALDSATHWVLGSLGGFHPATTAGEGGVHAASSFARPWAVPLVVGGGALVAAVLVFAVAPEAEGHGTDAAIAAVHSNPKGLRPRAALVKIVASALTIGSGGSAGREGPTAQISATFGSMLSRALNLTPSDSRIAVSAGIASGIGAIFRAPLGGAVLGAELLFRDDVEIDALIPSIVASVVAFGIYGAVSGSFDPIFGSQSGYKLPGLRGLALFALVGLACGVFARIYAAVFYRAGDVFARVRLPRWLKPALAGVAVGGLGLAIPGVLGTGYGQLQQELDRHALVAMPLWVVLLLPAAKIVATTLTVGSGGSGGIFGPGMVIGGSVGAALWRLLDVVHLAPSSPMPFVIVAMTAAFGAVAHAPLAVLLMVTEMTGSLQLVAPAMVAVAVAVVVVGDTTIYRSQLASRADSPAHRFSVGLQASVTVPIDQLMAEPKLVLAGRTDARDALSLLAGAGLPGAPVVNRDGAFIGSVQTPRLQDAVAAGADGPIGRLADVEAMTVPLDAGLDAAVDAVASSRGGWVPVLDDQMHVVGVISTSDLVRGWRIATRNAMRRLGSVTRDTVLVEHAVPDAVAGETIGDLRLPHRAFVVAVHRSNGLAFPRHDTVLQAGDVLSILVRRGEEGAVRALLSAGHQPATGINRPLTDVR